MMPTTINAFFISLNLRSVMSPSPQPTTVGNRRQDFSYALDHKLALSR
jgi:hypothetical protein